MAYGLYNTGRARKIWKKILNLGKISVFIKIMDLFTLKSK
jgi:hypothetical protein